MTDIYQNVTNKIVAALDQGIIPWIKPWSPARGSTYHPFPINAITGRPYRGVNIHLLWAEAQLQRFSQDRWLTFNQARSAGGHIRKGEHSTLAVLYKTLVREAKDEHGKPILDEAGNPEMTQVAWLKANFLFNIEQTEGLEGLYETEAEDSPPTDEFDPNLYAEQLLQRSGARIVHRPTDQAFYNPSQDLIQLPERKQFDSESGYYATALHELTHWTGHASRLKRHHTFAPSPCGVDAYAFEELVAEMGAAFLCARAGIQGELRHEGYINSWLKALKSDKKFLFLAGGFAREASEYLINLAEDPLLAT